MEEKGVFVINLLGSGFEAGVCVSAPIIYSAGWVRRRNLQVADSEATQFIRDCKYEPDKYVLSGPLSCAGNVCDWNDALQSALAAAGGRYEPS